MMSRFHFNYKTVAGTGSLILDDCAETNFAHFRLLGNSAQGGESNAGESAGD